MTYVLEGILRISTFPCNKSSLSSWSSLIKTLSAIFRYQSFLSVFESYLGCCKRDSNLFSFVKVVSRKIKTISQNKAYKKYKYNLPFCKNIVDSFLETEIKGLILFSSTP